jgi:hypothetical protein
VVIRGFNLYIHHELEPLSGTLGGGSYRNRDKVADVALTDRFTAADGRLQDLRGFL